MSLCTDTNYHSHFPTLLARVDRTVHQISPQGVDRSTHCRAHFSTLDKKVYDEHRWV